MMWLGTMTLAACMFVSPKQASEGLPAKDPHTFLNLTENCTCCHDGNDRDGQIEPHAFTIDIVETCSSCHSAEMLGLSHKVGVAASERFPDMEVPENLPVDEDDRITCGTCHNPHLPGYTTERYASLQEPAGTRIEEMGEVAYYKSYYLRLHAPEAGNDPTCAGCHAEMF